MTYPDDSDYPPELRFDDRPRSGTSVLDRSFRTVEAPERRTLLDLILYGILGLVVVALIIGVILSLTGN